MFDFDLNDEETNEREERRGHVKGPSRVQRMTTTLAVVNDLLRDYLTDDCESVSRADLGVCLNRVRSVLGLTPVEV